MVPLRRHAAASPPNAFGFDQWRSPPSRDAATPFTGQESVGRPFSNGGDRRKVAAAAAARADRPRLTAGRPAGPVCYRSELHRATAAESTDGNRINARARWSSRRRCRWNLGQPRKKARRIDTGRGSGAPDGHWGMIRSNWAALDTGVVSPGADRDGRKRALLRGWREGCTGVWFQRKAFERCPMSVGVCGQCTQRAEQIAVSGWQQSVSALQVSPLPPPAAAVSTTGW